MVLYVRRWVEWSKYVILFVVFTYALYHMLITVSQWIEPTERYKEPTGRAVKVFNNHLSLSDQGSMGDRLKLFYWLGE
ncbi:DUF4227 family protein [Paenibacillus xerothermodurans]|uniref:DUF4227 family protein n=1 Tax=Paenibacillus xerothermodurans TaxID=1977292 RepID=A0A2W1NWA6_PAEXE|nr:DUF4227 family protein [Paenibacillus xerothermodurans]PZE22016.1 DUF4227 family protein [Paenibacillus xerothermodurans]